MRFVTAVVDTARRHDYDVLLLATDDDVSGIRRVASSALVDGVVAMGVKAHDDRASLVRKLRLPAAFIGVPGEGDGLACVDLDFERAGELAIDTLADAGHREVGVVGHPPSYLERDTGFVQRFNAGLERAASRRGIRIQRRVSDPGARCRRTRLRRARVGHARHDGPALPLQRARRRGGASPHPRARTSTYPTTCRCSPRARATTPITSRPLSAPSPCPSTRCAASRSSQPCTRCRASTPQASSSSHPSIRTEGRSPDPVADTRNPHHTTRTTHPTQFQHPSIAFVVEALRRLLSKGNAP